MALMTVTPGTRVLGGLSAPRTSAAEQFQAGLQANLTRQDTKQAMRAREQAMELAQSEEARRQAAFEQQQAAAARAAAARAQQQRAFDEYTRSLQEQPAGLTLPTAFPVAAPLPAGMQLPPPALAPDALPRVDTTPVTPTTPAAPAPTGAPRGRLRIEGAGGADRLGGGAGADTLQPAAPAAVEAPGIRAVNPQASALVQDVQGILRQGDIATAVMRIQDGLATGVYGPMSSPIGRAIGYAFDSPEEAELRTAVRETAQWFKDPRSLRFLEENPDLLAEAAADPISFVGRIGEPPAPPAPPAPEPEVAGMFELSDQLVMPEGDSIAGLTITGRRDPVAGTEAAARAAPQRDISQYFMSNPNLTLDLHTQLARERQMLEARLRYAEATQNISLYEQTFSDLNSRERLVNENMINGQIAILAAQQDNFGPLQEFLNRAYPNDNVEVIPYTNGTVSFFVNGREDGEPTPVADLLDGMARTFNAEYREALAAAAAQQAEREQFLFENATLQQLQAAREISVAQATALAEIETQYGQVDVVGDLASGDKLFQTFVPDRGYVQFRIVEAGQPLVNGQPAPAATVEEVPQVSPLR